MPAMVAPSASSRHAATPIIGMSSRRLAFSSITVTRAVRADAPTETLDPATVDAISSVTSAANEAHAAALAKAKEEAASWTPAAAADVSSLKAKVMNSVADVQQGLLEREVEVSEKIFFVSFSFEHGNQRKAGEASERRGAKCEFDGIEKKSIGLVLIVATSREIRFSSFSCLNLILFFPPLSTLKCGIERDQRKESETERIAESEKEGTIALAVACSRERKKRDEVSSSLTSPPPLSLLGKNKKMTRTGSPHAPCRPGRGAPPLTWASRDGQV